MKTYRLLNPDEPTQKGDEFYNHETREWRPSVAFLGEVAGNTAFMSNLFRRPIEVDEWIDYSKQKPTRADGFMDDCNGHVVEYLWQRDGVGPLIASTAYWNASWGGQVPLYWRRITPPTPVVPPIKINVDGVERQVIVNPDKSVTVGCTTVPAETMKKIIERIEA